MSGGGTSGAGGTGPGGAGGEEGKAEAVARLTEPDLPVAERRRALRQIAAALRESGRPVRWHPRTVASWLVDTLVRLGPHIPIRSASTLRAHYPGLADDQIARCLVRNAGRASAGVGAVGGGVGAVPWAAPPTLLAAPVLLAAETVAVVAIELKVIGELQALYGQPVAGGPLARTAALLQAWAGRRGVNVLVPGRTLTVVLSTAAREELRDRLLRRFGRNLTTLAPLLTGAAVAAWLNRRATLQLAQEVRADLLRQRQRQRQPGPR